MIENIQDIFNDILRGLKKMAFAVLLIALCASLVYGVISAILVLSGKMAFVWYDIPCWIICFIVTAGCIGSSTD